MMHRIKYYCMPALAELHALLFWWLDQLHAAFVAATQFALSVWQTRALITLNASGGALARVRRVQIVPLFSFYQETGAPWPTDLKPFGSIEVLRNSRATVVLANDMVLTHEIVLPEATERALSQVIPLYLEREFPLTLDTIAFDHAVVRRDRVSRQISVRVLIIRRAILDRVVATINAWHIRPIQVGIADSAGQCVGNFLKTTTRQAFLFSSVDKVFMTGILLLAIAMGSIVIGQWQFERYQVRTVIEQTSPQADKVRQAAKRLQSMAAPAKLLSTISHELDAADLLERLTDQTPTDTWVYQLRIRAPALSVATFEIGAFTPLSLDYVKKWESAADMQQVKLVSTSSDAMDQSLKRIQMTMSMVNSGPDVKLSVPVSH